MEKFYYELIKQDSRFGKIVCRCETVSEGEVVDIINRNAGATTIKGVKMSCKQATIEVAGIAIDKIALIFTLFFILGCMFSSSLTSHILL